MSDRKRAPSRLVLGTGAKRSSTTSRADTLLVASPPSTTTTTMNSSLFQLTNTIISRSLLSPTQWIHLDLTGLMEAPWHLHQPPLSNTILEVPLLETLARIPSQRSTDLLQSHWKHHCEQFMRQNPQVPLTKDGPSEPYDVFWRRLVDWHQQKTLCSANALRELYKKDSSTERQNTKVISTTTNNATARSTGNKSGMDSVRMRLLNHTKNTKTLAQNTASITRRIITKPRLIPPKK